jgi:hypothetical protein
LQGTAKKEVQQQSMSRKWVWDAPRRQRERLRRLLPQEAVRALLPQEPPHASRPHRQRKPTLAAALKAAAGRTVKSAAVEGDKVTLTFSDGSEASVDSENEWDKRLRDLGYGQH